MPAELVWHPQANEDLLEIYVVIGLDNPAAAKRFLRRVEAKVELLRDQPRLGPRRADIRPSTRILIEGPYLILYETYPDSDQEPIFTVAIIRVVDGRRDVPRLF